MSDLTPAARKLLTDARPAFGPSDAARERMRADVLRRAAGARTGASDAPPSGARLSLKAQAGKLLGASLVALVAASYVVARSSTPAPLTEAPAMGIALPPAVVPTTTAERLASPHELPEAPRVVAPTTSAPSAPATSATEADARRRPTAVTKPGAAVGEIASESASPNGTLGAEMQLLREAQGAFKSGDLALARRRLDDHARTFPDGVLREERLVLGVLLSCAEGEVTRARRLAGELAAAHPRSSHLDTLRGSCAGERASGPPAARD